jgi:hypothetical protein
MWGGGRGGGANLEGEIRELAKSLQRLTRRLTVYT